LDRGHLLLVKKQWRRVTVLFLKIFSLSKAIPDSTVPPLELREDEVK
jgi:hypothetical protein